MTNLLADLSAHVKTIQNLEVFELANSKLRRLSVVVDVFKIHSTKGPGHAEFGSAMQSGLHSLQLDPPLPHDFPTCWLQAYLVLQCQSIIEGPKCWSLVCKKSLVDSGFAEDDVNAQQREIVKHRIVAIAKLPVVDAVTDQVRKLTDGQAFLQGSYGFQPHIIDAMTFLHTYAFQDMAK